MFPTKFRRSFVSLFFVIHYFFLIQGFGTSSPVIGCSTRSIGICRKFMFATAGHALCETKSSYCSSKYTFVFIDISIDKMEVLVGVEIGTMKNWFRSSSLLSKKCFVDMVRKLILLVQIYDRNFENDHVNMTSLLSLYLKLKVVMDWQILSTLFSTGFTEDVAMV